ncbi:MULTISPECIES: GatB/YqeY domain-containing protein [Campylobacter]|uniref:GatB/YqeY domain-containing protein n=1 Tax=Campylobacter TaxID=194 RepID=UPI0023F33924|nr:MULTISPECIES: GatB/YqeY domain-containing protein [Campylobacter]MCI6642481.1 GatB/YqeY domain-containing protein [Campylobacter sp.]MDD7422976.1 GatB/YqeY domain-containing protein [Campylobacter hominis]MDY3116851.1 GatB/YqeY domain-containing protein [Campylobacter hominis]
MLREQILEDIKSAMKSGDTFKRDALRMVNAALKQVEVDERIKLSDERVISILQKEIKSRVDSVEAYKKGGRDDLVKKEQGEIELIKTYLPAELSDDELKDEIKKIISETGACGMKFMGEVMKLAKERIGTKVNGKRLSEAVKKYLA